MKPLSGCASSVRWMMVERRGVVEELVKDGRSDHDECD